jgi:hypothetical protein
MGRGGGGGGFGFSLLWPTQAHTLSCAVFMHFLRHHERLDSSVCWQGRKLM